MQSKTLQPDVTLEWPKTSSFKLSYGDISVYRLVLTNDNAEPVAVEASTRASGCLLRPRRLLVPGKSSTTLTLAIKPGSTFEKEDLERTDSIYLLTVLRSAREVDDLDALFDMANRKEIAGICLKNELFFTYIPPTEEEKAASDKVSQIQIKGLVASRLRFQYTSPGYITAYLFIKCTLASDATGCTAWRLTPSSPFWYSLPNACKLGEFPDKGDSQHDSYAFGFLSPGESHLAYIDLKAYGDCFRNGAFKGGEQAFVLEAFPLEANPRQGGAMTPATIAFMRTYFQFSLDVKEKIDLAALLPNNLVELLAKGHVQEAPPKATPTFVFKNNHDTRPYDRPPSVSLTLSNPSLTHTLVYRLQAEEPSLFQSTVSLGTFLTLLPGKSATLTVELDRRAKLNGIQLLRLDSFLLDKTNETGVDTLAAMMRSMDARQMVTSFIPCKFNKDSSTSGSTGASQYYQDPISN